jgi:5-methylcytosine-specific restriction protein A
MFGALVEAVDTIEITTPDDLVAGLAVLDRLTAKLTIAAGQIDAAGTWAGDGDVSLAAFLRRRARMSNHDAWSLTRRGRRLQVLPHTAGAWEAGRLSGGQVQAVLANVTDRNVEVFAEQEAELLRSFEPLSVHHTAVAMRHWKACADAVLDRDDPEPPVSSVHLSPTLDGRTEVSGSFDAASSPVIHAATALAETPDVDGEPVRPAAQRRADAWVDIFRFYLDHHDVVPSNRHRPHVNVVIDLDDLEHRHGHASLLDGAPLDSATTRQLLCDATIHRHVTDGPGVVLDHGRGTRTATNAQWNALIIRDRGCRFPGCDRKPAWCEAHHVVPWEDGGPTDMDNLVLACSRHHHLVHQPGWQLKRLPDGTVEVTTPTGRHLTSHPPP